MSATNLSPQDNLTIQGGYSGDVSIDLLDPNLSYGTLYLEVLSLGTGCDTLNGMTDKPPSGDEAILLADRICVMTARPGRITRTIPITLPRPRSIDDLTSAEFNRFKAMIMAEMRGVHH